MSLSLPALPKRQTRAADPLARAIYDALNVVAFGALPVLLTAYVIFVCISVHAYAIDFHQEFWPAAWRVLHGLSPYARSWQVIDKGVSFPYPAFTAIVFVPLALLPRMFADGAFTAVNIGAVLLTLRVLRVRDWRIYGLVLVWSTVIDAYQAANLTLLAGLGIALIWRRRNHPLVAGALLAVLVSLKPFVWPIAVWFLATRRYAALAYSVVAGLAINLFAWGVLGFDQIRAYESLARAVTDFQYKTGYTVVALGLRLGAGHGISDAVGVALAGVALAGCLYLGWRHDERGALTLGIVGCLLATPVLWVHYFALLLVPTALARPRLSAIWFVPLVLWVCPVKSAPWQIALALAVNTIVVLATFSPARSPDSAPKSLPQLASPSTA